jgi:hypothetical protein
MMDEPAAAVTVPPQLFETRPTIVNSGGRLSVQEAFVKSKEFGLKILMRSREVPPMSIDGGVNCLLISAGREI